jgi:glycosyltransferase involved in cell wall biosynthesis
MGMILIDALFINKGGGAVLLQYLIERILATPQKDNFFFVLDPRFHKPDILHKNYQVVNNKMRDRIRFYKEYRADYSKVFCFANTPPPVRMKGQVYTYFHNQKLLAAPGQRFKRKHFSQYLKFLVVKLYNKNTDYYIVQTKHMVDALTGLGLKDNAHCLTIPFYDDRKYLAGSTPFSERAKDSFVFISNPSPQKNYPTLFDAWEYLLEQKHTPVLHVTIDDTAPQLIRRMQALNARGAGIVNHVYVDPRALYFNCRYLIFPSTIESFGLPLIEAVDSGMKVIASDLPYVHDVVKPSLTFDPMDKMSIANAVLTALESDLPFPEIVTGNSVDELIKLLVS